MKRIKFLVDKHKKVGYHIDNGGPVVLEGIMRKALRMNFETIMSFVGCIVIPVLGWLHRETANTKKELADFKTEVAKEYAMKEEFKRLEDKLDDMYKLLYERLPKKED